MGVSNSRRFVLLLEQTRKLNNIYHDRWMSPKNWIKLIQKHFDIPEDIKPTSQTLAYGVNGYYNKAFVRKTRSIAVVGASTPKLSPITGSKIRSSSAMVCLTYS